VKSPILGSSYQARSPNAAFDRLINLFAEVIPEGGKEAAWLQRAPGLRLLQAISTGPIRGLWANTTGTAFYVVSGSGVYRLTSATGTPTLIGTVTGTGPVSIADNGTQLFFACNPDGYIYNETTGVFAQITDPDFPGAVKVGYIDGYFVFNEPDSQRIWVTTLLDGTSVDPLDFASAEGSPDQLIAIIVDHREVWAFGTTSAEVFYNSGQADFPLTRIQGAFNEIGCAAPYSVAKMDNQIYWLGKDARGFGMVYRAAGYIGQRISTHAVEWQIQQYGDLSGTTAFTYQQDGHSFYQLNFPQAGVSWVFDAATGAWHERAYWGGTEFERHRADNQCAFGGTTIVGDYVNGNIYALDPLTYSDNGNEQRWLRSWRALPTTNYKRSVNHSLQIDVQAGVGLNTGQGSDPQIVLRWSDDGGHTWSSEHSRSMGAIGKTGTRVIWRRLGATMKLRDRVYEISGTDPVKIAIMGAELIVSGTAS